MHYLKIENIFNVYVCFCECMFGCVMVYTAGYVMWRLYYLARTWRYWCTVATNIITILITTIYDKRSNNNIMYECVFHIYFLQRTPSLRLSSRCCWVSCSTYKMFNFSCSADTSERWKNLFSSLWLSRVVLYFFLIWIFYFWIEQNGKIINIVWNINKWVCGAR